MRLFIAEKPSLGKAIAAELGVTQTCQGYIICGNDAVTWCFGHLLEQYDPDDYDEAWRSMRITSYTDLILMKIYRTKQIEALSGNTLVSEGIDANYMDMINYSVFALIKLEFGE